MLVAQTCLDSTTSFVTSLLNFMTDTYQDLIDYGVTEDTNWKSVSQLVNYIFTDDMDKVHIFVREARDTHSREDMARVVLLKSTT